jgi:DNA-binding NarL/FixJ family response regulator
VSNADVIPEVTLVDKPIHLLIVDSPTLHRRSLAAVLNRRRSLQVVGDAGTGAEAIAQIRALHPDVVVVEPRVPGGGPSLIADLCQEGPSCAVLVLTGSNEESEVRQALQAGARGYLDKDREPNDLVRAIERIQAGELVVTQLAANTVLKELSGDSTSGSRPGGLTTRELEVLRLVAQGRTNPQIAQELYITEHTAKAHLAKILNKLELDNRVQLATYAMQQGLTPPPDPAPQLAS